MNFDMSDQSEFRCFIGGLSWSTSDKGLREAFEKFGRLTEAKVQSMSICGTFTCFTPFYVY